MGQEEARGRCEGAGHSTHVRWEHTLVTIRPCLLRLEVVSFLDHCFTAENVSCGNSECTEEYVKGHTVHLLAEGPNPLPNRGPLSPSEFCWGRARYCTAEAEGAWI